MPKELSINQRIAKAKKDSHAAAKKLTAIGMAVIVTDDFGKEHATTLTSLPWELGHGTMICHTEKFPSYCCERVRPLAAQ